MVSAAGAGVTVAFWNRDWKADAAKQAEWLAASAPACGCPPWEILMLAEVKRDAADVFLERLQPSSHRWWGAEPESSRSKTAHGVMILSRGLPLGHASTPVAAEPDAPHFAEELLAHTGPEAAIPRAPRPAQWLTAPAGDVRLVAFHAPYAGGDPVARRMENRLAKRRAYMELTEYLVARSRLGERLVVGMDSNHWTDFREGDTPVRSPLPRRRNPMLGLLDQALLFEPELAFHGPDPPHGLIDTLRRAHHRGDFPDTHGSGAIAAPSGKLAVTFRKARSVNRMDRIYASRDIPVIRAGVCHGPMTADEVAEPGRHCLAPGSDHALVWAELGLTLPSRS